jgi:hypothetical protein
VKIDRAVRGQGQDFLSRSVPPVDRIPGHGVFAGNDIVAKQGESSGAAGTEAVRFVDMPAVADTIGLVGDQDCIGPGGIEGRENDCISGGECLGLRGGSDSVALLFPGDGIIASTQVVVNSTVWPADRPGSHRALRHQPFGQRSGQALFSEQIQKVSQLLHIGQPAEFNGLDQAVRVHRSTSSTRTVAMLFQPPDARGKRTRSNAVASGVDITIVPVSVRIG